VPDFQHASIVASLKASGVRLSEVEPDAGAGSDGGELVRVM